MTCDGSNISDKIKHTILMSKSGTLFGIGHYPKLGHYSNLSMPTCIFQQHQTILLPPHNPFR